MPLPWAVRLSPPRNPANRQPPARKRFPPCARRWGFRAAPSLPFSGGCARPCRSKQCAESPVFGGRWTFTVLCTEKSLREGPYGQDPEMQHNSLEHFYFYFLPRSGTLQASLSEGGGREAAGGSKPPGRFSAILLLPQPPTAAAPSGAFPRAWGEARCPQENAGP